MQPLLPRYWLDYVRRCRLRILMYHSISDSPGDRLAVRPEMFAAQMQYLAEKSFQVISLQEASRKLDAKRDLRRQIVLTFDDGYRDFLTNALPVLQEYGFPATIFVVMDSLNMAMDCRSTRQDRPLLSAEEVGRLKETDISVGSHSMTHPDLTALEPDALQRELVDSRQAVATFSDSFFPFAYPGGRFSRRERDAVERAGYTCGLIVGGRWGNGTETDRFLLRREPMLASDSLDWFARRVNGYYEWHYILARLRGKNTR